MKASPSSARKQLKSWIQSKNIMHAKINEVKKNGQPEYPMLMISKNEPKYVVLFTKKNCGMMIQPNKFYERVHYSENWLMAEFEPFTGTITLSNEEIK